MNLRVPEPFTVTNPTTDALGPAGPTAFPVSVQPPSMHGPVPTLAQRAPDMVSRGQRYTTLAAVALFQVKKLELFRDLGFNSFDDYIAKMMHVSYSKKKSDLYVGSIVWQYFPERAQEIVDFLVSGQSGLPDAPPVDALRTLKSKVDHLDGEARSAALLAIWTGTMEPQRARARPRPSGTGGGHELPRATTPVRISAGGGATEDHVVAPLPDNGAPRASDATLAPPHVRQTSPARGPLRAPSLPRPYSRTTTGETIDIPDEEQSAHVNRLLDELDGIVERLPDMLVPIVARRLDGLTARAHLRERQADARAQMHAPRTGEPSIPASIMPMHPPGTMPMHPPGTMPMPPAGVVPMPPPGATPPGAMPASAPATMMPPPSGSVPMPPTAPGSFFTPPRAATAGLRAVAGDGEGSAPQPNGHAQLPRATLAEVLQAPAPAEGESVRPRPVRARRQPRSGVGGA
jgi:hypothetical protein